MKRIEFVALKVLQGTSIALGIFTFSAIVYAIVQVATGNYHSTASFEF